MHVLVVEDDARLAEALARILEDNGYTTDVVHDGEAGVRYGETGTYDVIILDVMLPKADGFTVAQRLRRADGQIQCRVGFFREPFETVLHGIPPFPLRYDGVVISICPLYFSYSPVSSALHSMKMTKEVETHVPEKPF